MKKMLFLLVLVGCLKAETAADYSSFPFAMACTLKTQAASISTDLYKFPFLVRLTSANASIFLNSKSDGSDIRITKADSTTPLPFDIARWDKVNQVAEIWVRLDTLKQNSTTQVIKFQYGNASAVSAAFSGSVFDTVSDYVGAWHLEEDVTGAAPQFRNAAEKAPILLQECVGTAINMTAANQIPGIAGRGVSGYVGSNAYVNLSGDNSPRLDLEGVPDPRNTNFTISSWVYLQDGTRGDRTILGRSRYQYYIGTQNAKPFFTVCKDPYYNGFSGDWYTVTSPTDISLNSWHNITGVFRPDSMLVFIDGVLAAKDTSSYFYNTWSNFPLLLGNLQEGFNNNLHNPAGINSPFPGQIDEPRLLKIARSPSWIKMEYENQQQGSQTTSFGSEWVRNVPASVVVLPDNFAVLSGTVITSKATTGRIPPFTYKWYKAGAAGTIITTFDSLKLTTVPSDSGAKYVCEVTTSQNSVARDTFQVQVYTPCVARLDTIRTFSIGEAVTWRSTSTGNITSWEWSLIDTAAHATVWTKTFTKASNRDTVQFSFQSAKVFQLQLKVTGPLSNTSTFSYLFSTYQLSGNPLLLSQVRRVDGDSIQVKIDNIDTANWQVYDAGIPFQDASKWGRIGIWYGRQGLDNFDPTGLGTSLPLLDTLHLPPADRIIAFASKPTSSVTRGFRVVVPGTTSPDRPDSTTDRQYGIWVSPIRNGNPAQKFYNPNGIAQSSASYRLIMVPNNPLLATGTYRGNSGTVQNVTLKQDALDSAQITVTNIGAFDTTGMSLVTISYSGKSASDDTVILAKNLKSFGSNYVWKIKDPNFWGDIQTVKIKVTVRGRNGLDSIADRGSFIVGWPTPTTASVLSIKNTTVMSQTLSWTRDLNITDARILRSDAAIPLSIVNDTTGMYIARPPTLSDTFLIENGLQSNKTYYYALQVMRNFQWSRVASANLVNGATLNIDPSKAIPNNSKINSVTFNPARGSLMVKYSLGALLAVNVRYVAITYSPGIASVSNINLQPVKLATAFDTILEKSFGTSGVVNDSCEIMLENDKASKILFDSLLYIGAWVRSDDPNCPWNFPHPDSIKTLTIPFNPTSSLQRLRKFVTGPDTISLLKGNVKVRIPDTYSSSLPTPSRVLAVFPPAQVVDVAFKSIAINLETITNINYTNSDLYLGLSYDGFLGALDNPQDLAMYYEEVPGKLKAMHTDSVDIPNKMVWARIKQNEVTNKTFVLGLDSKEPTLDTSSMVGRLASANQDFVFTFRITDNISNVKWNLVYGWVETRPSKPDTFTFSRMNAGFVSGLDSLISVTISGTNITGEYGLFAWLTTSDGRYKKTIPIGRQVENQNADDFFTKAEKWVPIMSGSDRSNISFKSCLGSQLPDSGKYNNTQFRVFQYADTGVKQEWIELVNANESLFEFTPGKVMWLKTRNRKSYSLGTGKTLSLKDTISLTIPAQHWLDFGVPFSFSMRLGDVFDASGLQADKLDFYKWVESAGTWTTTTFSVGAVAPKPDTILELSLASGVSAYAVYNSTASDVVVRIPPVPYALSNSRKAGLAKQVVSPDLIVSVSGTTDAGVSIGEVFTVCKYGDGSIEYRPLPPTFASVQATILTDSGLLKGIAVSKAQGNGGMRWNLAFVNSGSEATRVSWKAAIDGTVPLGWSVRRYDAGKAAWVALDNELSVTVSGNARNIVALAAGSEAWFQNNGGGIVTTTRLALDRCGYVRASGKIRIAYTLPSLAFSSGALRAQFMLHDMSGRLVSTVAVVNQSVSSAGSILIAPAASRKMSAGIYVVTMQVINAQGKPVASLKRSVSVLP